MRVLQDFCRVLQPGCTVLDVGAGLAPYRELFTSFDYLTCDQQGATYTPETPVDIVASAYSIPLGSATLDAVVCTQVLEHLDLPGAALEEFRRLIRAGGKLLITAPFVWYLHEEPNDYFRFTSHGLRVLLERAGFSQIEIRPLNDSFSSLAQLVAHLGWMIGRPADGHNAEREVISITMSKTSDLIASFAGFDSQWILPLDFAATAQVQ